METGREVTNEWTRAGSDTRPHRRAVRLVLPLLLLVGCGGGDGGGSRILPLQADLMLDPPPAPPAIYFELVDIDQDLVTVRLVFDTGGSPIAFDVFNLEIHLVDPANESVLKPGIAQVQLADIGGPLTPFTDAQGTPLVCGDCVATCVDQSSGVLSACHLCDSAACTAPGVCGGTGVCTSGTVGAPCTFDSDCTTPSLLRFNPLCRNSATDTDRIFIWGAALTGNSGCSAVSASGKITLLTLGLLAAAPGEVRVKLVHDPTKTGDCEILDSALTEIGDPCNDRNALFTATR